MSFPNEFSYIWLALLVGALAVPLYISVQRHRRCRNRALMPYARRTPAGMERPLITGRPLTTEDQKVIRMQESFIHHPPVDLGYDPMPLEFQQQMKILVRMQGMYRNGTLFPHH